MAIEMPKASSAIGAFARREAEEKQRRIELSDRLAPERDRWRTRNAGYHHAIERLVRFNVPEGASVLEIGSATGDLLAALKPRDGLGIDLSPAMVELERRKHSSLRVAVGDAETVGGP